MPVVYLSLGSNVGDRQKFLKDAIGLLAGKVKDLKISSIYETEPWGEKNQPQFLNMCAAGQTELSPEGLLSFVKSIESDLGRTHTKKWGPREIDIDILFYSSEIIKKDSVEIPHPYLVERAFVLAPLSEIASDFVHPVLKKTVKELADAIGSQGISKVGNHE